MNSKPAPSRCSPSNVGTGQSVGTGDYGRTFGQNFLARYGAVTVGGEFEGGTPFQRHAGHMIVVSDKHGLLLDPTFAQFQHFGDPAVGLFAAETRLHKSGRFWHVGDDEFSARYFTADDFMDLDFELVREASVDRAEEIVAYLKK